MISQALHILRHYFTVEDFVVFSLGERPQIKPTRFHFVRSVIKTYWLTVKTCFTLHFAGSGTRMGGQTSILCFKLIHSRSDQVMALKCRWVFKQQCNVDFDLVPSEPVHDPGKMEYEWALIRTKSHTFFYACTDKSSTTIAECIVKSFTRIIYGKNIVKMNFYYLPEKKQQCAFLTIICRFRQKEKNNTYSTPQKTQ